MEADAPSPVFIHATAFAVGEVGVLVRGDSGSGKSSLAASAIRTAHQNGQFAALVGDDRIHLQRIGARIVMRPHPAITGLIEQRGLGLIPAPFLPAARLSRIVDLLPGEEDRMPEPHTQHDTLLGIAFPRLAMRHFSRNEAGHAHQDALFWAWMSQIRQDA
jgi:HPr kinase/phosphorylase